MNRVSMTKDGVLGALAVVGTVVAKALGGWDKALIVLMVFMAADYLTGLIVAGVFKKSGKSPGGALDSRAGFKGLCKKGGILLVILVAAQLDELTGAEGVVRTVAILFFIGNEGLSILENVALMGVPIPEKVKGVLEALKEKDEGEKNGKET